MSCFVPHWYGAKDHKLYLETGHLKVLFSSVDFIVCDTYQTFWWIRTFWTNALSPSSRSFRLWRRTLHIYFECKHPLRIVHNCTVQTTLMHTSMRTSNLTSLFCRICGVLFKNLILQTCHVFHIKAIKSWPRSCFVPKSDQLMGKFSHIVMISEYWR